MSAEFSILSGQRILYKIVFYSAVLILIVSFIGGFFFLSSDFLIPILISVLFFIFSKFIKERDVLGTLTLTDDMLMVKLAGDERSYLIRELEEMKIVYNGYEGKHKFSLSAALPYSGQENFIVFKKDNLRYKYRIHIYRRMMGPLASLINLYNTKGVNLMVDGHLS